MNESQECFTEQKKPESRVHIVKKKKKDVLYESIYVKFWNSLTLSCDRNQSSGWLYQFLFEHLFSVLCWVIW